MEGRYDRVSHRIPLEVGDVTVHIGWTLHCADAVANSDAAEDDEGDRYAFSVTCVKARAEPREGVLPPSETDGNNGHGRDANRESLSRGDDKDIWSFRSWAGEVEPQTRFRHPMVPTGWPPEQRDHTE